MSFMRDRWYVAAWDSEVDRSPLARTICGEPIMLYRKLDRGIVAMRDACPHRLLPLSLGLREDDSIRCLYHGLKIGPDGFAEQMPMKREPVSRALCVQTYRVVERYRFVWIWIGDPALADVSLLPDFWPCEREGWVFDGGYSQVECDYRLMIDNLMDLTHETHVHAGSIGQPELMETPIDYRTKGERIVVTRWMAGVDPPPFWSTALRHDGPVDRWQICNFLPPANVLIDVGVSPVGAGATIEDHDQGVRGFVVDACTPRDATGTHYFWGMARNFDQHDSGFTARFKAQQATVFAEDVAVLEAQQRSIAANPDLKLRAFSIDSGGVRARRVIEKAIGEKATG